MSLPGEVRPSPIAGRWYPGDPQRLAAVVDGYLADARPPELHGEVVGLISPHAGYQYSGATAAHAFKTVQGQHYDIVAVVSPFHDYPLAPIMTTVYPAYGTPLGKIPVDTQALTALVEALRERKETISGISRDSEHSLEIELPFLQRALDGPFTLLPVMAATHQKQQLRSLGEALAKALIGRKALLVASSDLSHFYDERTANKLDAEMLRQISAFSPAGALNADQQGSGFACGVAAIAAVLWAASALGANSVELLHHSTSADQTHDRSSVVGYGAAAILKAP